MANVLFTVQQMRDLLGSTIAAYYKANDETEEQSISFVYNQTGTISPYDANVPTSLLSFLTDRDVLEYVADITGLTGPSGTQSTAQLLLEPIYAHNCTYFDLNFIPWANMGEVGNCEWRRALKQSFYYAEIDGEPQEFPVNPTDNPDQLHIPLMRSGDALDFATETDIENNTARCITFRLGGTFTNQGVNVVRCSVYSVDSVEYGISQVNVGILYSEDNKLKLYIPVLEVNEEATVDHTPVIDPDDREENAGPESTWAGGNGTFTAPSDNRGDGTEETFINDGATAGNGAIMSYASNAPGGYHIYNVNQLDFGYFATALYDYYLGSITASGFNPLSAILTCHLIPSKFIDKLSDDQDDDIEIYVGAKNVSMYVYDHSDPHYIMCEPEIYPISGKLIGTFNFVHYFDAFPDFAPYTTVSLHLPYIGTISLDVDKIMYGTISVFYNCDVISGNVVAWVWCKDREGNCNYCYTATGNCSYSFPLYASQTDGSALGKLVASVGTTALGLATENPTQIIGGLTGMTSTIANSEKPKNIQVNGVFGGSVGMVNDTKVWIEIKRPEWVNPSTYAKLEGMPAELGGTIESLKCHGKTTIKSIEMDNIDCTDEEKAMLVSVLQKGIFIAEEEG